MCVCVHFCMEAMKERRGEIIMIIERARRASFDLISHANSIKVQQKGERERDTRRRRRRYRESV
jgi:hypothetical protein